MKMEVEMAVKLLMLIEIDVPTAIQDQLEEKISVEEVQGYTIGTARHFVKQYPFMFHWMKTNGYMELDMMMSVGGKKNEEEVAEPVAQPAPL
jgi:hypothetical protein